MNKETIESMLGVKPSTEKNGKTHIRTIVCEQSEQQSRKWRDVAFDANPQKAVSGMAALVAETARDTGKNEIADALMHAVSCGLTLNFEGPVIMHYAVCFNRSGYIEFAIELNRKGSAVYFVRGDNDYSPMKSWKNGYSAGAVVQAVRECRDKLSRKHPYTFRPIGLEDLATNIFNVINDFEGK